LDGTNSLSIFAHLGLLVVSLGQPCRLKRGYSIFGWPIPWMGGKGLDSNFYAWIYWYDLPKKHILPNRIQAKSSPQTLLEKFTGSLETNKAEDTTLWKRKQHIYSNHQFLRAQCPCSFWEEFMCVCVCSTSGLVKERKSTWYPKQPFVSGCFNWMIPNLYLGNSCLTSSI